MNFMPRKPSQDFPFDLSTDAAKHELSQKPWDYMSHFEKWIELMGFDVNFDRERNVLSIGIRVRPRGNYPGTGGVQKPKSKKPPSRRSINVKYGRSRQSANVN